MHLHGVLYPRRHEKSFQPIIPIMRYDMVNRSGLDKYGEGGNKSLSLAVALKKKKLKLGVTLFLVLSKKKPIY